jgi:predicted metal-binding transcription factor (methanogenesis marker protein 9)
MVDAGLVAQILTVALGVASVYFAGKYRRVKRILKELAEAVGETYKALEDNKITEEELRRVVKEWNDLLRAVKGGK